MVERTKIAALLAVGSIVLVIAGVALYRFLEYVGINPLLVLLLAAAVFALAWIYDALTEQSSPPAD